MATIRERQELREAAENLESEADELEGLVTWFSINLPDATTNTRLQILRDEVVSKRREREEVLCLSWKVVIYL